MFKKVLLAPKDAISTGLRCELLDIKHTIDMRFRGAELKSEKDHLKGP